MFIVFVCDLVYHLMSTYFTENFLGDTSNRYLFDGFKISIVNYTEKVSEEWHFHDKVHISSIVKGGNLESRKTYDIEVDAGRIMVYDQGEIHRNRFTAHPSKNLNIEFEDHFFNSEILLSHLKPDERTNTEFQKIYFELLLNDVCTAQSIEQIVMSLFWCDKYENKALWIPKLKELLNDRWDEFLSLDDLSKEMNIHPVTISKYFAKNSGLTLSEYMRKIKVKRAIDMLINSSISFSEIALSCGFSDQSHMNRLVKKHTGYTPSIIRSLM